MAPTKPTATAEPVRGSRFSHAVNQGRFGAASWSSQLPPPIASTARRFAGAIRGSARRAGRQRLYRAYRLLDLDADEIVSEELAGEILKLFASGEPDADVFRLPLAIVDPSGRIWRKARAPRRAKLYDRRKVRIPAHGAWDQFRIPAGLRVRRLEGPLLHYAFDDIGHLSRKQGSAMVRRVRFLDDGRRRPVALRVRFGLPVFFLRNYLLRGQWREGRYGFLLALTTAYNHWLRYAMLYERRLAGRGDKKDAG